MVLEVHAAGVPSSDAVDRYVRERLGRSLARVGHMVRGAQVRLDDVNGPRGGHADKRCAIVARLTAGGVVNVTGASDDMYAAIDDASKKLSYAVKRRTGALRTRRHRSNGRAR